MSLDPGVVIDRYEVESTLGQGGMAVVYRVRHRTLGSWHALKILTVHGSAVRDRLIREGRVQASLVDPNIVAVTDVIDVNGSPGLIMQFVDGPTLESWLKENRPDLAEAERLFEGILSALEHAHSNGVVHRDLKPANVLLARAAGKLTPRVADFGLAKALHEEGAAAATRAGALMGTPSYMAPEQIRDASTTDHRGDIFALGCILYELVTGQVAFQGEHYLDIFNDIRAGHYPTPASVNPDLPLRVDTAIRGCLVTDRDRRIPDCATLRRVLAGEQRWSAVDGGLETVGRTLGPGHVGAQTIGPISFFDERESTDPARAVLDGSQPVVDGAGEAPARPESSPTQPVGERPARVGEPAAVAHRGTSRPAWQLGLGGVAVLAVVAVAARLALPGPGATAGPQPSPDLPASAVEAGAGAAPTTLPAGGVATAEEAAAEKAAAEGATEQAAKEKAATEKAAADKAAAEKAAADKAAADKAAADKAVPDRAPAGGAVAVAAGKETAAGAATARFGFSGAEDVRLTGAAGSFGPGALPPGEYTIKATFNGHTNPAGSITLSPGQSVTLRCDADFATCEK